MIDEKIRNTQNNIDLKQINNENAISSQILLPIYEGDNFFLERALGIRSNSNEKEEKLAVPQMDAKCLRDVDAFRKGIQLLLSQLPQIHEQYPDIHQHLSLNNFQQILKYFSCPYLPIAQCVFHNYFSFFFKEFTGLPRTASLYSDQGQYILIIHLKNKAPNGGKQKISERLGSRKKGTPCLAIAVLKSGTPFIFSLFQTSTSQEKVKLAVMKGYKISQMIKSPYVIKSIIAHYESHTDKPQVEEVEKAEQAPDLLEKNSDSSSNKKMTTPFKISVISERGIDNLCDISNYTEMLTVADLFVFSYCIFKMLTILHEQNIVHGDTVPSNWVILSDVLPNGEVMYYLKLIDWDNARGPSISIDISAYNHDIGNAGHAIVAGIFKDTLFNQLTKQPEYTDLDHKKRALIEDAVGGIKNLAKLMVTCKPLLASDFKIITAQQAHLEFGKIISPIIKNFPGVKNRIQRLKNLEKKAVASQVSGCSSNFIFAELSQASISQKFGDKRIGFSKFLYRHHYKNQRKYSHVKNKNFLEAASAAYSSDQKEALSENNIINWLPLQEAVFHKKWSIVSDYLKEQVNTQPLLFDFGGHTCGLLNFIIEVRKEEHNATREIIKFALIRGCNPHFKSSIRGTAFQSLLRQYKNTGQIDLELFYNLLEHSTAKLLQEDEALVELGQEVLSGSFSKWELLVLNKLLMLGYKPKDKELDQDQIEKILLISNEHKISIHWNCFIKVGLIKLNTLIQGQSLIKYFLKTKQWSFVKFLIEEKIDINQLITFGKNRYCSLLHLAVQASQVDIVTMLLQMDQINLYLSSASGETALDIACRRKNLAMIKLLKEAYKKNFSKLSVSDMVCFSSDILQDDKPVLFSSTNKLLLLSCSDLNVLKNLPQNVCFLGIEISNKISSDAVIAMLPLHVQGLLILKNHFQMLTPECWTRDKDNGWHIQERKKIKTYSLESAMIMFKNSKLCLPSLGSIPQLNSKPHLAIYITKDKSPRLEFPKTSKTDAKLGKETYPQCASSKRGMQQDQGLGLLSGNEDMPNSAQPQDKGSDKRKLPPSHGGVVSFFSKRAVASQDIAPFVSDNLIASPAAFFLSQGSSSLNKSGYQSKRPKTTPALAIVGAPKV